MEAVDTWHAWAAGVTRHHVTATWSALRVTLSDLTPCAYSPSLRERNKTASKAIMDAIQNLLNNSGFRKHNARIITGQKEASSSWTSVNYLKQTVRRCPRVAVHHCVSLPSACEHAINMLCVAISTCSAADVQADCGLS